MFKKVSLLILFALVLLLASCDLVTTTNKTTAGTTTAGTTTTVTTEATTIGTTTTITTMAPTTTTAVPTTTTELIEEPTYQDFTGLTSRQMEGKVRYDMFWKPSDGFVGDVMPYYENGVFYIFYLKDGGSSYNHSIFLAETTDFIHYEDKGEILRSSSSRSEWDNWIGTGSICKVDNTYYFFYTGHNAGLTPNERVMVATSEGDLYHFKKLEGVYIDPTSRLSQVDFRDPDVTYDKATDRFILTVTTNAKSGGTVIVKYNVNRDFTYEYEKIIYTDTEDFWNLECTDTFKIGNYWYLSYSGQDDTLWVAKSRSQYTGYGSQVYGPATRIEGKYFYAPKSVSDGVNTYFVGWGRRRGGQSDTSGSSWAGNLVVSKVVQNSDGSIYLAPIDTLNDYYRYKKELDQTEVTINSKNTFSLCKYYENFMIDGEFTYKGNSDFGFAIGLGLADSDLGQIRISPSKQVMQYVLNNGAKVDTEVKLNLKEGETYGFKIVSEGSVVVLYINGQAAMTTRYYGKFNGNFGFYTTGSTVTFSNLELRIKA